MAKLDQNTNALGRLTKENSMNFMSKIGELADAVIHFIVDIIFIAIQLILLAHLSYFRWFVTHIVSK